ncbi:DinB/UmuC family translesion DNA polymerase [Streptomyces sp. NPDC001674]|uniref:DinB/UmuC family translesion DNA polymerase n=1 Tax=Streptomyces sp. NPDC001674 TaxID=3154394 RepID=UPI0033219EF4
MTPAACLTSPGPAAVSAGTGVLHVRCAAALSGEGYREVLELLREFSPLVQALPPRAALVQVRGARRYFGADAARIAEVVRLRAVARLGTDVRIGVAGTWTVAAMASARVPDPGGVLAVPGERVAGFLAPLPVEALHGLGPRQADALRGYGLHTVGALTAVPPGVLERILGKRAGRLVAERARGIDPRPVTPRDLPSSAAVRTAFTRQELDGPHARAALLGLVVRLGAQLRGRRQAARSLCLTLQFAGGARWERSRRLTEPSAHDEDLRTLAYRLMDAAGLQRARLTGMVLRAEDLTAAEDVTRQLSLDPVREARLTVEAAIDRANARFGPGTVRPAALFQGPGPSEVAQHQTGRLRAQGGGLGLDQVELGLPGEPAGGVPVLDGPAARDGHAGGGRPYGQVQGGGPQGEAGPGALARREPVAQGVRLGAQPGGPLREAQAEFLVGG